MAEKVFVLSSKPEFSTKIKSLLPRLFYSPVTSFSTIQQLKMNIRTQGCDLLIIQDPLKDGVGWKLAREVLSISGTDIVLLVSSKQYDQIVYQLQGTGVFVLACPVRGQDLYQSLELMRSKREEIRRYQEEISKLKKTIHNDRLINRAKMMLIESYHWSEDKAHHYIEQISMKSSMAKVDVAKQLIEGIGHES